MNPELNPCPFCGSTSLYLGAYVAECVNADDVFWYHVECENPNCRADGPWDLGKSGAIKKWNERAAIAPRDITVNQSAENVTGTMIGLKL